MCAHEANITISIAAILGNFARKYSILMKHLADLNYISFPYEIVINNLFIGISTFHFQSIDYVYEYNLLL